MTPDIVVDIGNSRMKWGVCRGDRVVEVIRLPLHDLQAWDAALAQLPPHQAVNRKWALASVNPPAMNMFVAWSGNHGATVVFESYRDLPIRLNVDEPEKVGLDRLLGAIAARSMTPTGSPAITVDVGTAVTVNLVDADGVFQGGAILPGPGLMASCLGRETAALPHLCLDAVPATGVPGKSTIDAIRAGIAAAIQGGVGLLVRRLAIHEPWPLLFITGGAQGNLSKHLFPDIDDLIDCPELTLEGIRIAAEALP